METFPMELDNALFAFNIFQYIPIDIQLNFFHKIYPILIDILE